MNKTAVTVSVVALAVSALVYFGKPIVVNVPTQGSPVVNFTVPEQQAPVVNNIIPKQDVRLGSITSNESYFPFYNQNGVTTYPTRITMNAATNTPCVIFSPKDATTTLNWATFAVNTSTSTAGLVTIATSTVALPFATTTALVQFTVPANQKFYGKYTATTTDNGALSATNLAKFAFAPGTPLVFGVQGLAYPFTYGGTCQAEFLGF